MAEQAEGRTAEEMPQLKLENQLCFPLYAAARQVVNQYTPWLKPYGLTYTQYIVFLALWEHGEETVGQLGRQLYLDCGTLTPMLKKMEERGWIRRTRSREDERVVRVTVTESGWALREEMAELPMKIGGCISLSPEDAVALHRLLHTLLEAIPEDPEERKNTQRVQRSALTRSKD